MTDLHTIAFRGKETSFEELSQAYSISIPVLYHRYRRGDRDDRLVRAERKSTCAKTHSKEDYIGLRLGHLIIKDVIFDGKAKSGNKRYTAHCLCDCGNECDYRLSSVLSGNQAGKRCPVCNRKALDDLHRKGWVKERVAWTDMINRCNNPKSQQFQNYGARGITVCDRWASDFQLFLKDMGKAPGKQYSLDRIDNNGNYEPSNCRWATIQQQANNRRTNHLFRYGKIIMTCAEWGMILGVQPQRIRANAKRNGGIEHFINKYRQTDSYIDNLLTDIEHDDGFISLSPIY